jgi:cytochrome c-type biogenesis protein CcmH/NrfG
MSVSSKRSFSHAWRREQQLVLPIAILVLTVALWLLPGSFGLALSSLPTEISPSQGASLRTMISAWGDNPVLGSGPETFPYTYGASKAASLNNTNFWGLNFNNASSEVITWGTTTGPLGLIALVAFAALFIFFAVRSLRQSESLAGLGLFTAWVVILVSKFLYQTPLAVELFFWVIPALFLARSEFLPTRQSWFGSHSEIRSYSFQSGSIKTLGMFVSSIVLLVAGVCGLYLSFQRFVADGHFVRAAALNSAESRSEAVAASARAISLAPVVPRHYLAFAQVSYGEVQDLVAASQATPQTPEEQERLRSIVAQAQNSISRMLVALGEVQRRDPNNVSNLITAGELYRSLAPLVSGSLDLAVQTYEKAVELEPINPFLKTQLAHIYLLQENFFAGTVAAEGNERVASARVLLDDALRLNNNYSNARYFLGFILDREGKHQEALEQFTRILAFNQDNVTVQQIVTNLSRGGSIYSPPVPQDTEVPPVPIDEAQGKQATEGEEPEGE